jgi:hypothetical protein
VNGASAVALPQHRHIVDGVMASALAVDDKPMAAIRSHSDVAMRIGGMRVARYYGVLIMTQIISQKAADQDQAAETAVEGEIREFVRRDGASLRRAPETDSELVANNVSALLQRVAGSSVQEIDRLIAELQTLRNLLHDEGVRVQREIAEYAHLSQSAMQSTKIIAESLAKWKGTGEWSPRTASH